MTRAIFASALLLFASLTGFAQRATKITITYTTTAQDKDWNSQVRDSIVCNGITVAELDCCDQNRQMDHWDHNTTTSRDILSPQPFLKGSLHGCTFNFGMIAVGNDTWSVVPQIQVFYDDGSNEIQNFTEVVLQSSSSLASKAFPLN